MSAGRATIGHGNLGRTRQNRPIAIPNYSAGSARQNHRARGARHILIRGVVWRGHASFRSPATAGLRQREWDRADGQQQKQIKRASEKVRFDSGVNLFFYLGGLLVICRDLE